MTSIEAKYREARLLVVASCYINSYWNVILLVDTIQSL